MTIIKMQRWMLIVERNEHSWNSKCALHVRGLNYTGRSSVIWFVTHLLTCWLADSGLEHKQTSQRMAFPWGPDRGIQKTPTRRSKKEAEKLGSQGRIKRPQLKEQEKPRWGVSSLLDWFSADKCFHQTKVFSPEKRRFQNHRWQFHNSKGFLKLVQKILSFARETLKSK